MSNEFIVKHSSMENELLKIRKENDGRGIVLKPNKKPDSTILMY